MAYLRRHARIALVAITCLALGAGASAIATAGATTHTARAGAHAGQHRFGHGLRARGLRLARRAVHAELVVPTKQGFATVTIDRGTVDSVSGDQLTLTEGTPTQTYKTVTLTIPSNATIRSDREPASLGSLTKGQRVRVISVVGARQRTFVVAHRPRAQR